MADKGRPLPKFGEWDVNNPASADGFTVIFAKARDENKTPSNVSSTATSDWRKNASGYHRDGKYRYPKKSRTKWLCCV